jgi:hypothetical protein
MRVSEFLCQHAEIIQTWDKAKFYLLIGAIGFWAMIFISLESADAYEFPPYRGFQFKITSNLSENYSNNITYTSDNESRVEDFMTNVAVGLDLQYEGKTRFFGFSGRATRRIKHQSTDVSNPSENVTLTFRNALSKYSDIVINNTFVHTLTPGRDIGEYDINRCRETLRDSLFNEFVIEARCNEFAEEFGRFKGRFDSFSNALNIGYRRDISEDFSINSNYVYSLNWSTQEGTNDSDRHALRLTVNYKYSEPTIFSLSYNYQISNFENGQDISRQSITAGITQYITKRLYFKGNIGADRTISGSGDNNITGNATLTGELDEKTTATLSYLQETRISANSDDTFKNWQITGRFNRTLLEDLRSSLSGFYGQGEFSSTNVTDTLLGASFNLSYNFWRSKRGSNVNGNLGYSYSNLDSTDKDREYKRNSINSGLTLAF